MSQTIRYLVTTDAATGVTLKVERVGDAGELTEVPAGTLGGAAAHVCQPHVVLNIHVHGPAATTGLGFGAAAGVAPGPGVGPGPTLGVAPGPGVGPGPTSGVAPGPGVGPGPTSGKAPKPEKA